MVNVSDAFREELEKDNRRYYEYATITLTDNTVINITNANIWTSGWKYEESTSGQGQFEVGAFIIGKFTLVLNNIYGDYDDYIFDGATVIASIGLELPDNTIETIQKGVYTVTEVSNQNSSLVTLECLDYGTKFNRPYSDSTLTYPATLMQIVEDACETCGVAFGMEDFPHSNFIVSTKPTDETLTFGGVISAAAQISCSFVKMRYDGALTFGWYQEGPVLTARYLTDENDMPIETEDDDAVIAVTPATDEDIISGDIYPNYHRVVSIKNHNIAADDVVITGVKVVYEGEESDVEVTAGSNDYVISIERNPLISSTAASEVVGYLGEALIGLSFRPMQLSVLSDPTIETGDRAVVIDYRNKIYTTFINNLSFTAGNYESISCEAETPARNNAYSYNETVRTYQQLRQSIQSNRAEMAVNYTDLSNQIESIAGGYVTESELSSYADDVNTQFDDVWAAIQGTIEQWTGGYVPTASNAPASSWTTTALKEEHQGDVFFNTSTGYSYRWVYLNSTWQWILVSDTDITTAIATANDAYALAGVKRRCFLSQPTTPYDYGDIWMQGPSGDILVCTYVNGRPYTSAYVASDWTKQNKYTDNTVANQALNIAQNHTHTQYSPVGHTHTNITTYNNGSLRGIGSSGTQGRRVSMFRTAETVGRLVCVGQFSGNAYDNYYVSMTSSDKRIKKNIEDTTVDDALSMIAKMRLRQFDWKSGEHVNIGFIADELEEIDPTLSIGGGYDEKGNMVVKSIEVLPLIGYLTKGIQELTEQVEILKREIELLRQNRKGDEDYGS